MFFVISSNSFPIFYRTLLGLIQLTTSTKQNSTSLYLLNGVQKLVGKRCCLVYTAHSSGLNRPSKPSPRPQFLLCRHRSFLIKNPWSLPRYNKIKKIPPIKQISTVHLCFFCVCFSSVSLLCIYSLSCIYLLCQQNRTLLSATTAPIDPYFAYTLVLHISPALHISPTLHTALSAESHSPLCNHCTH